MLYFILTNKANFQIDEKFIIPYEGSTYENKSAKSAVKNKANQSQFYGEPVEPFFYLESVVCEVLLECFGEDFLGGVTEKAGNVSFRIHC